MSQFRWDVVLCSSLRARIRGLIGQKNNSLMICLIPCGSIHTYGMKCAIDVCFCDSNLRVVKSIRGLEPRRHIDCRGAVCVIERFASHDAWPHIGEQVELDILYIK